MDASVCKPIVSLAELQAYVRVETGEEEALLAGLIRTASAVCENFLNQAVIARPFAEQHTGTGRWQALAAMPVRLIEGVTSEGAALAAADYRVDVDDLRTGWIMLPAGIRGIVSGVAGLAADQNGVPEPIRQGVLRLVSHLYTVRDSLSDEPPAIVTALWRPYRRLVLA